MQAAAKSNLKHVSLELGGKSPLIIFDDADVDKAAELALFGLLTNKVKFCLPKTLSLQRASSAASLPSQHFVSKLVVFSGGSLCGKFPCVCSGRDI